MDNSPEILNIPDCPLCSQSHSYKLTIKRTSALSAIEKRKTHTSTKFTVLLTCPVTREEFQADFVPADLPNQVILSIVIDHGG